MSEPQGRPRTRWKDNISQLACERLVIPQKKNNAAGERGASAAPATQPQIRS